MKKIAIVAALLAAVFVAGQISRFQAEWHESEMQTLRNTDVPAYLSRLKAANDSRYESELKALDPKGYEEFRKLEISKLTEELKGQPSLGGQYAIFTRLMYLDPANQEV